MAAPLPGPTLGRMRRALLLASTLVVGIALAACGGPRPPGPKPVHSPGHLKPSPGHIKRAF